MSEVWQALADPPPNFDRQDLVAELHGRLVRIMTYLFLPLLAFPLGLDGSFGLPVGFVLGHQAFASRVLRLDPRSMRLSID